MASPFVAGLAGLVWSTSYGTNNGNVRDRIQATADQAGSMWSSYGIKRINAYNAVASATPPPTDTTPPTISAVQATPAATTATVTWTTDELSDSRVDYGLDTGYGSPVSNSTLVTGHSIALNGLSPATTYHYRVSSRDAAGNSASSGDYTFTTTTAPVMSIGSVSVVLVNQGVNYTGQAAITIMSNGQPVQGATVSGQWSGATTDTDSGVTDASGTVLGLSDRVRKPTSGTVFTFTVTSVVQPDFVWDGANNSVSTTVP